MHRPHSDKVHGQGEADAEGDSQAANVSDPATATVTIPSNETAVSDNTEQRPGTASPPVQSVTADTVPLPSPETTQQGADGESPVPSDQESPSGATSSPISPPAKEKKVTKRCEHAGCRKKTGMIGFRCRCGLTFCTVHRYDSEHSCTFNYQALGREELRKANLPCVASRVTPI